MSKKVCESLGECYRWLRRGKVAYLKITLEIWQHFADILIYFSSIFHLFIPFLGGI